jgi:fatty acid-binding protein DegV
MIKEQLARKYPQAKIVCIDNLNSCMGLGLMCIRASELRLHGMNVAIEKVKGRMTSIDTIVQRSADEYTGEWNKVAVVHADCEMDHNVLVDKVKSILPKDVEVITGTIGPIIGASAGPGTIAVYLLGKEVTFDSRNK